MQTKWSPNPFPSRSPQCCVSWKHDSEKKPFLHHASRKMSFTIALYIEPFMLLHCRHVGWRQQISHWLLLLVLTTWPLSVCGEFGSPGIHWKLRIIWWFSLNKKNTDNWTHSTVPQSGHAVVDSSLKTESVSQNKYTWHSLCSITSSGPESIFPLLFPDSWLRNAGLWPGDSGLHVRLESPIK